ncbi:biosynthetic-type acetolactate synthase large subunit [Heliophilum fasciatum]|uniref:Acetolactate synthase n=1 Tax=Heliophilum fasciatum TaxID=35700 RepID=A0A4R2RM13_9FIRM|nr:biosynthetic-type acetolactate synthase large subunit [Heliophilum fasciatum]MCW2277642.1 acetolactate synthase-1/2/3 large subunit [Heliophilum fasciatum]TCP64990.1 acetolactate synthase large subunit [Heliophilum fasciatum]
MELNGAQALLKALEANGVDVIFGYPGGSVLPIYDALLDSPIHHILVRCEQGAAHAASGYARASGRPGVCLATSGPGATNLVTGIANAYMDSIPMVAITGQVPSSMVGTDAFQEVDITGITMPIIKHSYLVQDVTEIPRVVQEAFHLASTGRPGPVLIDIPKDVQQTKLTWDGLPEIDIKGYKPTFKGHPAQIKNAVHMIEASERPVILVGGGIVNPQAPAELMELARKAQIPVTTTLMAVGAFPETDDLSLGLIGMHGTAYANLAVSNADLLIGIGVRFGDRATGNTARFAKNAKIIHIDIDPAEIGKNTEIDLPIVGDAGTVLAEINRLVGEHRHDAWMEQIATWKRERPLKYRTDRLTVQYVLEEMGDLTRDRAIVATDVGQHQMWAAQHYKFLRPGQLVTSAGLGCMGFGLPAANGVQVARPDDLVILVTGDGSIQMQMQELGTARQENLPLKIVLFNNNALGMVRQLQHFYCDKRFSGVKLSFNPDFIALAKAYGIQTYQIHSKEETKAVLEEAFAHPGIVLVEVLVDENEIVYPSVLGNKGLDETLVYE